ncbi:S1C family serine protease [Sporosarcina limicola]|uniref:S1-C subfamily serine protease n=1 Tax=Sporosarcina limicola TaxID=34101 RepID=A0A927MKC6_9BACL|nr:serine protease [Sporosarcina limicola]MBE1555523.1 S1-C subfamily serine protease [Sporosarcina limicola]
MNPNEKQQVHFIEDIDDDELQDLVLEAQREALSKEAQEKRSQKKKRPFPKWLFWLISIVMVVNTFAVIFEVYSIPAIEFLKTSARLSSQTDIASYKKSVVVILTKDSKGTGFSISSDGTILTNYHVIEGNDKVMVTFPDEGRFTAKVVHTYPAVDLAVLEINGEDLPYLELAKQPAYEDNEPIYFIGNPLSFTSIANEGTIIESIKLKDWEEPVMMIKAPVYRGNSGSPVLDRKGQVIGVVFATLEHETHGNVGLFVPIDAYYRQQ